jgi:hypothetical protein
MITALIPIVGPVLEFIGNNVLQLAGGTGAVLMVVVTWLARKYLVPLLELEKRRRYARYIAIIADEVTDDLVRKYPDEAWLQYIDEAVDKIISVCHIDIEVARRATSAALARK